MIQWPMDRTHFKRLARYCNSYITKFTSCFVSVLIDPRILEEDRLAWPFWIICVCHANYQCTYKACHWKSVAYCYVIFKNNQTQKHENTRTMFTVGWLDMYTSKCTLIVASGRLWIFELNLSVLWVFLFTYFSLVHLLMTLMKVDRCHRKFSKQKIYRSDIFIHLFKPFLMFMGKAVLFFSGGLL